MIFKNLVSIYDNFYENPDEVRNFAMSQNFKVFRNEHGYAIPGLRSQPLRIINQNIFAEFRNKIIKRVFGVYQNYGYEFEFDISVSTQFQITRKSDGDSWVHRDEDNTFAGLIYLNPNPPENSGTIFYRLKNETLLNEKYPTIRNRNRLNRFDDVDNYEKIFEVSQVIKNVYNRAIIFTGSDSCHKSDYYFGKGIKESRLTQPFFVKISKIDIKKFDTQNS